LLHNTSLRFLATRILAHNTTIRFLSLRENEFVSPDDRSGLRFTRALYSMWCLISYRAVSEIPEYLLLKCVSYMFFFSQAGDDADAVPEVLSSLKTNSTLIFLDLSGNAISFENVSAADWHNFSENRSLVYLLLANTRVGKGVDDRSVAKTFEKFMTSLPKTLRFLDLAHNELEGNVLEKIALVLEKNQNIVHLDLSDNFFGYSSAVHLSHILQMAQSLKRFIDIHHSFD
jgi:Leucine-rich repeat (LRR) protein